MPDLRHRPPATGGRASHAALRPSPPRDGALSKMGHELRSPLNGIIGLTRVMLMKHAAGTVDAAQQVRQLTMVQTSAERLLATIERLADIANIESGGLQPRWETVDCRALAAQAIQPLQAATEAERPDLILDLPDRPVVVTCDPVLLSRLVRELLVNAVTFTPPAGTVRVRVWPVDADGTALIAVDDNGPGIPEPEQARIFDAFVRGENAGDHDNGSGLGLHLALRLAELLGAQLGVHSDPGAGSSFTVAIPAERPDARAAPTHSQGA